MKRALSSIPAYALPKNQQVDHFFPNASRAFLGYYIPLFTKNAKEATASDLAPCFGKKVIGCTSLGLSGPHTFCTMENSTQSQDLLYAPAMFDLNELLEVVERAWLSREKKSDPDKLDRYRYDSIMRWTVPAYDDNTYEEVKKIHKESVPWGPKRILFRLRKRRNLSGFDFKKMYFLKPTLCSDQESIDGFSTRRAYFASSLGQEKGTTIATSNAVKFSRRGNTTLNLSTICCAWWRPAGCTMVKS